MQPRQREKAAGCYRNNGGTLSPGQPFFRRRGRTSEVLFRKPDEELEERARWRGPPRSGSDHHAQWTGVNVRDSAQNYICAQGEERSPCRVVARGEACPHPSAAPILIQSRAPAKRRMCVRVGHRFRDAQPELSDNCMHENPPPEDRSQRALGDVLEVASGLSTTSRLQHVTDERGEFGVMRNSPTGRRRVRGRGTALGAKRCSLTRT